MPTLNRAPLLTNSYPLTFKRIFCKVEIKGDTKNARTKIKDFFLLLNHGGNNTDNLFFEKYS